jgi:signal transduction histidine kinase/ligand-binding sensor domain-containing protein
MLPVVQPFPHDSGAASPRDDRRRWRVALLSVIALAVLSEGAWALDPHRAITQALLRKWQFPQGLPQATIYAIRQTADGYLWLGTQSGVYRFDGMRFVAAPGGDQFLLKTQWIHDLCEDDRHNLWIATNDAGLIRLNDGQAVSFGLADGLPSLQVRCLLLDREHNLWAGTDAGLARWDNGKFTFWQNELGLVSHQVRALCEAQDGAIWIAGDGDRLAIWNGSSFSTRSLAALPRRASVRELLGARDGSIWVGTTAGLIHLNADEERRVTRADGLADDAVECLLQSPDGILWAGTKDGLSRMQGDEIETFRTRDGLSQSTVYALCQDHEGGVWAGTKHGLNQFVDRRTIPLTLSEGLPSNDTGPIVQDDAGTVWIGTLGKGLARFDGRRCVPVLSRDDGLPSDTILTLADGGNGLLWIGTREGLCRMRDGRIEKCFTTQQGLPSDVISCLCRDRSGDLWVGTRSGLAKLDGEGFVAVDAEADAGGLAIVALADCGRQGLLVSAEGDRLFQCHGRRLEPIVTESHSAHVAAIFEDRDGLVWLGTQGSGLQVMDGAKTFRLTAKDGLYDDDVSGIVADNEDRLWMACSRGSFFVERTELLKLRAGEIARVTSTPFSLMDALRTVECQSGVQPVTWKAHDGRIWFSTDHGVVIIDPAHLRRELPPPNVVVEEAQVNGQDVKPDSIPPLPPGQTNLYFRYTALSYAVPTRITFRHKLDGFDKDWVDAGTRREAFYTNVPPGSYYFRVSASNLNGPWTEAAQPVVFSLAPHFYQTRWFIPLVVAGVAAAAWVASRLRVLQVKARLNAVLAERSRIARELHDTLIQGFSGVTMQMQALSARLRPSAERGTLEEIIQDAGRCLREARRSVGGLRSTPGEDEGPSNDLAAAVAQAARQLTETRDIRLALQLNPGPDKIPVDVEYNLLRIAQEAISNAVRHSGARAIEVTMNSTAAQLCLTVHDDGAGFHVSDHEPAQPGHYGLIGMRERAAQIHAALHLESTPGRGTIVRLELPTNGASDNGRNVAGGRVDERSAETRENDN